MAYDPLLQQPSRALSRSQIVALIAASPSTPSGPAGGDLTGTYPNPTLAAIVGATTKGTATRSPTATIDAKGRVTALSDSVITLAGDVTGDVTASSVVKINGNTLGSTTPTSGNLLIGSGAAWVTEPMSGDATITSAGVLTLSNAGIARVLVDPRKHYEWSQIALGTTTFTDGGGGIAPTASPALFDDTTGSYINYPSSTTLNATAGWPAASGGGSVLVFERQLGPILQVVIKTGASATDIANCTIWVGMNVSGGTDASATGAGIMFRFDPFVESSGAPGSDVNWQATQGDNVFPSTQSNVTDTGVVVTANTRYVLRIDASAVSTVRFYINDVLVATHTTGLVTATTKMYLAAYIINRVAGTARNIRVARAAAVQL